MRTGAQVQDKSEKFQRYNVQALKRSNVKKLKRVNVKKLSGHCQKNVIC